MAKQKYEKISKKLLSIKNIIQLILPYKNVECLNLLGLI